MSRLRVCPDRRQSSQPPVTQGEGGRAEYAGIVANFRLDNANCLRNERESPLVDQFGRGPKQGVSDLAEPAAHDDHLRIKDVGKIHQANPDVMS